MQSNDPIAEWRARWHGEAPHVLPPPSPRPPSLWLVAAASFGGAGLAIICCFGLVIGTIIFAARNRAFDQTPESLTYRNDTAGGVWVYECVDRCTEYADWFWMEPDEEASFNLAWYWSGRIDWVVVVRQDATYACIKIVKWEDQTVDLSSSSDCPPDIHSPTGSRI